jgi:hypothetical protein
VPFGSRASAAHICSSCARPTDLARLQATQSQPLEARKVLEPVYDFFTGGADFPDVREARAVLAGLDGSGA